MKKKIALIGGAGFIGHNLALKLKSIGHNPHIIDSFSVNNILNFTENEITNKKLYRSILNNRIDLLNKNSIRLYVEDARNYHQLGQILNDISPDIIIQLAAVSHANKSNKSPHNTFDNSLRTLENVLDLSKQKKTHLIYMSSSMVYGDFKESQVNENTICNPKGIYAAIKLSGELLIKSYNQVFDLPYTIIRPSALYGERCVSRRVGQIFIENILSKKEIIINGDGEEKLDFTYIDDLVDGLILCCEKEEAKNQTFNLTYGNSRKIISLIEILSNHFKEIKVTQNERDKLNPVRGTLSIEKAKKMLGYKPTYNLERGYEKYINWYIDYFKREFS